MQKCTQLREAIEKNCQLKCTINGLSFDDSQSCETTIPDVVVGHIKRKEAMQQHTADEYEKLRKLL